MAYGKWILPLALIAAGPVMAGSPQGEKQIAAIDLAKPFGTRSPWRFTATQGPEADDENGGPGDKMPGIVRLCISNDEGRSCHPDFHEPLRVSAAEDFFTDPHFLRAAQIVRPAGASGRALLLLRFASASGVNSDQRVGTQLLAYDRAKDRFATVFSNITGQNNNQEVRYVADGPLRGAVIAAEPTGGAPFGFWITVNRLTPAFTYKQVLRYRSATHYGDGNPLAVIDSEMPNIQQRLGLWRPGKPLPAPKGCARPHLVKTELWCS